MEQLEFWSEEYWKEASEFLNRLESIANIRADVEECRENPPVLINKMYDIHNINQRGNSPGDSTGEEVLDVPLAAWVSKKY
jgi:hypothetical protein